MVPMLVVQSNRGQKIGSPVMAAKLIYSIGAGVLVFLGCFADTTYVSCSPRLQTTNCVSIVNQIPTGVQHEPFLEQSHKIVLVEERLNSLERNSNHARDEFDMVAKYYANAFSDLKDIIHSAEWFIGVVLAFFGVILPIAVQIWAVSQTKNQKSDVESRFVALSKSIEAVSDKTERSGEKADASAKEATDVRVAVERQVEIIANSLDSLKKSVANADAQSQKASHFIEESRRNIASMRASIYYDTARTWIVYYQSSMDLSILKTVFVFLSHAMRYNLKARNGIMLNADIAYLVRIEREAFLHDGTRENNKENFKDKMRNFTWEVTFADASELLRSTDELSQQKVEMSLNNLMRLQNEYGRIPEDESEDSE